MSRIKCAIEKIQDKLTKYATVIFLDDTQQTFSIMWHLKGENLLNRVFKYLHLTETKYFGLQILQSSGDPAWVEPDKLLRNQWSDTDGEEIRMKFRVKYYTREPHNILDCRTRHLFYLQSKLDVFERKIEMDLREDALLASYVAQIELGDYIAIDHKPGYLHDLKIPTSCTGEFEQMVTDMHKLLRGLSAGEAEVKYLTMVKNQPLYGVHLYRAEDCNHKSIKAGISHEGFYVLYGPFIKIKFKWCIMLKAIYNGKNFVIRRKKLPNDRCGNDVAKFSMESTKYAKCFWKMFNSHYQFTRCNNGVNNTELLCQKMKTSDKISKTFTKTRCMRFSTIPIPEITNSTKLQEILPTQNENGRDPYDKVFHSSLSLLCQSLAAGDIDEQFGNVPRRNHKFPIDDGQLSDNLEKNYRDHILPYDCNRVILKNCDEGADYINASYINLEIPCRTANRYIATQGPLSNTTIDFWRMVQQENIRLIVMLTAVMEHGVHKCHQYWPSLDQELKLTPRLSVKCLLEQANESGTYVFRELVLIDKNDKQVERSIEHMQYIAWPDSGVPDNIHSFVQFRQRVKDIRATTKFNECISPTDSPIIVHCTAGISRTGVFILIDTALDLLDAWEPIYPTDILQSMRDQRSNFIQNVKQFRFACECICGQYEKFVHSLVLGGDDETNCE